MSGTLPYDLQNTARILEPLVLVSIPVAIWDSLSFYIPYGDSTLGHVSSFEDGYTAADLVLFASLAIFAVTTVYACVWIYRAAANAREMVLGGGNISPGWSVGWYFVPIAEYWMPYRAMLRIWRTSVGNVVPRFVQIWWFTWVVQGVIGYYFFGTAFALADDEGIPFELPLDVAFCVCAVVSLCCFWLLVRTITTAQERAISVLAPVFE